MLVKLKGHFVKLVKCSCFPNVFAQVISDGLLIILILGLGLLFCLPVHKKTV